MCPKALLLLRLLDITFDIQFWRLVEGVSRRNTSSQNPTSTLALYELRAVDDTVEIDEHADKFGLS